MQTSDLDAGRLRTLATTRPERGKVLSLYLDLDPSTVPPGRAREAAVTSLLDEVHRAIEAGDHTHEEQGGSAPTSPRRGRSWATLRPRGRTAWPSSCAGRPAEDHLHVAADLLFAEFQREPFDALLVGAPDDLPGRLEAHLHPYLRERLAGHLSVDVDATTPDALLAQAQGPMEERHRAHIDELLGRLRDNLGRGERASVGWADVLAALDERRVEALLLGGSRTDVREGAVEAAIAQDAEVARVAEEDLAGLGGVAAIHRF